MPVGLWAHAWRRTILFGGALAISESMPAKSRDFVEASKYRYVDTGRLAREKICG